MMMAPPQIVGVLLKKPGKHEDLQGHPRVPPLDPQEIKIRGELYVEDLGAQRMVTIRMGWLWVEGTPPMRFPLRALNLRQAAPSLCQPHVSALGFTLSNPQNGTLATFWADTEPIYWSWVRAIAAELVRQTPFRAQRCLNFLEILTICPRGPVPLPDSPTEARRRSRSELRSWFRNSSTERQTNGSSTSEESRRRTRSELRGWSSNSSDEDVLGEFRTVPNILPKEPLARPWAFSESSEGSDDSLPWGGGQSSVDSVDSVNGPTTVIPEPETREQRIQRYKEVRRRENEARSRRVVEEDAKRRRARAEENNNNVSLARLTKACYPTANINNVETNNNNNNNNNNKNKNQNIPLLTTTTNDVSKSSKKEPSLSVLCRITPPRTTTSSTMDELITEVDKSSLKKSTLVKVPGNFVRFDEQMNLANVVPNIAQPQTTKTDNYSATERRSRARERRSTRERGQAMSLTQSSSTDNQVETLRQRKERLASLSSRIPILQVTASSGESPVQPPIAIPSSKPREPRSPTSFSVAPEPCEEVVARLIERCQRVDHYVPVRDKLTLFESLSRLGGRLARSTEDLGRAKAHPSPRGKQRARSLHDLNRAAKSVPVREMCRFFEGNKCDDEVFALPEPNGHRTRFADYVQTNSSRSRAWSDGNFASPLTLPPTTITPKTTSTMNSGSCSPTKSSRRRQCAK